MYICAINPSKCIQPFPLKIESDVQENYEKQSADGKKQNGGWNTYIYSRYRLTKKNSRCLRSARFLPEASSAAGWWKFCIGCIASKIWILKNWPGKGCSRSERQAETRRKKWMKRTMKRWVWKEFMTVVLYIFLPFFFFFCRYPFVIFHVWTESQS